MSHLKECESTDRLSVGRNGLHRSFRQSGKAERITAARTDSDGICVNRSTFAEDVMLVHSDSGLLIAMMGSAGRFVAPKETCKSTQHYGFPS
jgi:hypothetical protein